MWFAYMFFSAFLPQTLAFFEELISPADIYWPTSWVSNNIETSTNHAGPNIFLTVHCRLLIDLPSGAEAILIIPGMDAGLRYFIKDKANAGEDLKLKFGFYEFDVGTYGPISLVIRQIPDGQIIASRASFGEIAIIDPVPDQNGNLSISFNTSSRVVSEAASLKFSFELQSSQRLEKYDYFVIDLDPSFSYTHGNLYWDLTTADSNFFIDTKLDSSTSSLIIYGLQNEVYEGAQVSFIISGFTNPKNTRNLNSFFWTLTIYRFGTPTIKNIFTGNGPDESVNAGTFKSLSWSFVNPYIDKSHAHIGLITYTKLSFTLKHPIPKGGFIYITYDQVDISLYGYASNDRQILDTGKKYIYANASNFDGEFVCSIYNSVNAYCEVTRNDIPKKSVVNIFNIVKFYGNACVTKIESMIFDKVEGEYMTIDILEGSSLMGRTLINVNNDCGTINSDSLVYFIRGVDNDTAIYQVGDFGSYGLILSIIDPIGLDVNDEVSIMFPLRVGQGSDLKKVTVENELYGNYTDYEKIFDISAFTSDGAIVNELNPAPKIVDNSISFTLNTKYSMNNYINIFLSPQNNNKLYLPYFPTTEKDMQELVIKIYHFQNSKTYYLSKPINFVVNTQGIYNFNHYCLVRGIPGLPVKFSFIPSFAFSDSEYHIQITFTISDSFDNDFGSGLDSGMIYPSLGDYKVIYEYDGENAFLYINLETLAYDENASDEKNTISFIIPFQMLSENNYFKIDVVICAISENERIIISLGQITKEWKNVNNYMLKNSDNVNNSFTTQEVAYYDLTLELNDYGNSINSNYSVLYAFDKGFKFIGNTTTIGGTEAIFNEMSSDNPKFNYAVGFVDSILLANSNTRFLFQFETSWFLDSTQQAYLVYVEGEAFTSSSCSNQIAYGYKFNTQKLFYSYYSPHSIDLYTNFQLSTDFNIDLRFYNFIYAGSWVSVLFNTSYFDVSNANWSIKIGSTILNTESCASKALCESGLLSADVYYNTISIIVYNALLSINYEDDKNLKTNAFVSVSVYFTDSEEKKHLVYDWIYKDDDYYCNECETVINFDQIETSVSYNGNIWAFPCIKGASLVHFGMSFNLNIKIPAGTKITISGEDFALDTHIQDNTWCNHGIKSVSITEYNKLEIITLINIDANESIKIIKDSAFSLDIDKTETKPFFITVKYNDFTIIKDLNNSSILIYDEPLYTVKKITISPEVLNQGVKNFYTFSFRLKRTGLSSYYYCFEASHEYDAHPGETYTFDDIQDVYYLYAKSSFSNSLDCIAEHWLICCTGFNKIKNYETVDLSIYLTNPANDSASFNFYVFNEDFNLAIKPVYGIVVNFTKIPDNIVDVYHFDLNYKDFIGHSFTATAKAHINASFKNNSMFFIEVPLPFKFDMLKSEFINCSAHYDGDDNNFIEKNECEVWMNLIKFQVINSKKLKKKNWTNFYFENIINPDYGLIRASQYDEEFKVYDYWTGKIKLFFSVSDQSLINQYSFDGRSYSNINSAFTGFNKVDYNSIVVNNGFDIIIKPGTYSQDIFITAEGELKAYSVTLIPSSETLSFNAKSYKLDMIFPWDTFKVGISYDYLEGYFLILWQIQETPLIPGNYLFTTPPKTQVQVLQGVPYEITTRSNIIIPNGYTSLPFSLILEANSFNNFEIYFITNQIENITFSPNPLLITPKNKLYYFTILCMDCLMNSQYNFIYELSYGNHDSFAIKSESYFTIGEYPKESTICSISLNIDKLTASIVLVSKDSAIVYWALVSKKLYEADKNYSSLSYIKKVAKPLNNNGFKSQKTIEEQVYKYYNKLLEIDKEEFNWEEYSRMIFLTAEMTYFASIQYIDSSESPKTLFTFDHLVAQTEYVVVAYIDNLSKSKPVKLTAHGSTTKINPSAKITIYSMSPKLDLEIINIMAITYKIDKRRISSRKTVYPYYYDFIIFSNPLTTISPVSIVNNNKNNLIKAFKNYDFQIFNITDAEELNSTDFSTLYFKEIDMFDNGKNYVEMKFTSTIIGVICCEFEVNPDFDIPLSSYNVLIGMSRYGKNITFNHKCDRITPNELYVYDYTFTNESSGNYVFSCVLCNNYPILPECSEELIYYEFRWTSQMESFGECISLYALMCYLAVIS